jgi:hypothetical protein
MALDIIVIGLHQEAHRAAFSPTKDGDHGPRNKALRVHQRGRLCILRERPTCPWEHWSARTVH